METKSRYDLNAAIESWRRELSARSGLTLENRRELEGHLRDAIEGFQQHGLTGEESFWLARRRIGRPEELAEEFVKADPAGPWRERIFWIALIFFVHRLWYMLFFTFSFPLFTRFYSVEALLPDWVLFYLPLPVRNFGFGPYSYLAFQLFYAIACLALIRALVRGKFGKLQGLGQFVLGTRLRCALTMLLTATTCFVIADWGWNSLRATIPHALFAGAFFPDFLWLPCCIALATWLLPTRKLRRAKLA